MFTFNMMKANAAVNLYGVKYGSVTRPAITSCSPSRPRSSPTCSPCGTSNTSALSALYFRQIDSTGTYIPGLQHSFVSIPTRASTTTGRRPAGPIAWCRT